MLYVDWFVRRLNKTFHVVVKEDEVSFEACDFYHEELDDLLIPLEHLEKLKRSCMLMKVETSGSQEWCWIKKQRI